MYILSCGMFVSSACILLTELWLSLTLSPSLTSSPSSPFPSALFHSTFAPPLSLSFFVRARARSRPLNSNGNVYTGMFVADNKEVACILTPQPRPVECFTHKSELEIAVKVVVVCL